MHIWKFLVIGSHGISFLCITNCYKYFLFTINFGTEDLLYCDQLAGRDDRDRKWEMVRGLGIPLAT